MTKKIIIFVSVIIAVCVVLLGLYNHLTIDSHYAKKFADVLCDYNIEYVDDYLSGNTKIICGDKEDIYSNCRKNVLAAFEEKEYVVSRDSSYGYGNNRFDDDTQEITIRLMGTYKNENMGECVVMMNLKHNSLLEYSIESIESDSKFFEYLFFGNSYEEGTN